MYTEYRKLKYTDEMYIIYIIVYGIVHDIFVAVLHTAEGVCFSRDDLSRSPSSALVELKGSS